MQTKRKSRKLQSYLYLPGCLLGLLLGSMLTGCGEASPTAVATPTIANTTLAADTPTPTNQLIITFPAITNSTAGPNAPTPPPPGAIKGPDGNYYWIVEPILPFYQANPWLGLPLGGMKQAQPDGYDWEGLYQNFQRGRVEAHINRDGSYTVLLGLVNQELLRLKR